MPIFRTRTVAADQQCLYQLRLCAPVITALELATFTFPLSPSSLRMERSSLSTYTDTQGSALSQGVRRNMDVYGLAPPIFTIEGTTGWDQHNTDGYSMSGLESMQKLAEFLALYASLNQVLRVGGVPFLHTLEFYDYFTSNFWQIEPVGPQIFQQDATRPLLIYYRFRWVATRPAGLIGDIIDSIGNALDVASQVSGVDLGGKISSTLANFTPAGLAPVINFGKQLIT